MTARNPQELAAFLESLEDYVPTVLEVHLHILSYVLTCQNFGRCGLTC